MVEERLSDIAERLRGVWFQPTEFLVRFRGHGELPPTVLALTSNSWHDLAIGIAHAVVVGVRGALKKGAALPDVLESYRIIRQAWPDPMMFHTQLEDESLRAERLPAVPKTDDSPAAGDDQLSAEARALRQVAEQVGPQSEQCGPWSRPKGPKDWGKVFGFSADTFKRRCKAGKIRHKKLSDRHYLVHLEDIPAPASTQAKSAQVGTTQHK